jgi:hypothetical protein
VAFGVAMLMEALFNAVDRAYRREAARTLPRFHLERKTSLEPPQCIAAETFEVLITDLHMPNAESPFRGRRV